MPNKFSLEMHGQQVAYLNESSIVPSRYTIAVARIVCSRALASRGRLVFESKRS